MAVFRRALERVRRGAPIVESHVRDMVVALQLPQHVERADRAALIERVQEFGLHPKDFHAKSRVPLDSTPWRVVS
jgi:hypothetical protein